MPRIPRLHIDGAFYHVILRGNHRRDLFFKPSDRQRFSDLVAEIMERFQMRVHAYCWMTNHIHMAVQVSTVPLGKAMMRLARRYAWETQRRLPSSGHFFERRYRALLVDADSYLLELIRYIHLNPVRAHLVEDPADYPWSGHGAFLGRVALPWLTTDFALSLFSSELNRARDAYRYFVMAGIGIAADDHWMTGHPEDPRILGDDSFLAGIAAKSRPRCRISLEDLVERVCLAHGTTSTELIAAGRVRRFARLRALVLHHALQLHIASLSDLSRHFHRSTSTLNESLEHYRQLDPDLFKPPLDPPPQ
jgi:putative transposase